MNYSAEIVVRENPDLILKCLLPESISRERSSVKAKKDGSDLKIEVEAKDAVAFRASINALTQLLAVYSKAKEIK